jgi:transcription termination factor Rho
LLQSRDLSPLLARVEGLAVGAREFRARRFSKKFTIQVGFLGSLTFINTASIMSNAPQGNGTPEIGSGYLEISEKGFGFLRSSDHHFSPKATDIFVTPDTIKKNFLREGDSSKAP